MGKRGPPCCGMCRPMMGRTALCVQQPVRQPAQPLPLSRSDGMLTHIALAQPCCSCAALNPA